MVSIVIFMVIYKHTNIFQEEKPDINGYYAKSTNDEVIKYIKLFKNKIDRFFKIKRILENK